MTLGVDQGFHINLRYCSLQFLVDLIKSKICLACYDISFGELSNYLSCLIKIKKYYMIKIGKNLETLNVMFDVHIFRIFLYIGSV